MIDVSIRRSLRQCDRAGLWLQPGRLPADAARSPSPSSSRAVGIDIAPIGGRAELLKATVPSTTRSATSAAALGLAFNYRLQLTQVLYLLRDLARAAVRHQGGR